MCCFRSWLLYFVENSRNLRGYSSMGRYNSLIRKAIMGLEKKHKAIYLLNKREFYSHTKNRKMFVLSLNKLVNTIRKGKPSTITIPIYSCVSEVDMLKRLAEMLKGGGDDGG